MKTTLLAKAVAPALAVVLLVATACREDEAMQVSVRAEIVEPGAPAAVEATEVREADGGLLAHAVRVEWRGVEAARLDDARFTHHVTGQRGHLVTAGRGCGADWDGQAQRVSHICTADLQLIEVGPRQAHDYPVRIYPTVGPRRLAPGTYVVEQPIDWWRSGDFGDPAGRFTVRLTYEVN